MEKTAFNDNWSISGYRSKRLVDFLQRDVEEPEKIMLPHDAMIEEKTTPDTENGRQTGFYPGGYYCYTKEFTAPEEWKEKDVVLEFEGVYMDSQVFVNGSYAGGQPDGYTDFFVPVSDFLNYGGENEVEVIANNSAGPNSRWYSGSGIYRNVSLWTGGKVYIPIDGVKIVTQNAEEEYSAVAVDIQVNNKDCHKHRLCVETVFKEESGVVAAEEKTEVTVYSNETENIRQRIGVRNAKQWDCDHPHLYECCITVYEEGRILDSCREKFGIRQISLDPFHGLRLNGKEIKLRGACIHHDNGVIGACTFEKAESRRCRQLKEAGFNCLRSSHHPMSKAMLDACDRYGMLVMDELSDMWNQRKNRNDMGALFSSWWESGVESMIQKDRNHPSVILYSTGNEIPEAGSERGAWFNRKIVGKIRELDPTRFVTSAINGNIAIMDELMVVLEDIARKKGTTVMDIIAGKGTADDCGGGSNGLNALMALLVGEMGDEIAKHPVMTRRLKQFTDAMDIAGYNYMTGRHAGEKEEFPNRVVIGAETFPSEIARLWKIVKENHHVIGDMTWTGYDYLGEAGIGICYYDGTNNFAARYPDRIAGCGDIDLIGRRRCISYLRETVYGLRKAPYIAVERPDKFGKPLSRTPWTWKDNVSSWTWPGYEGKTAKIDVISDADEVELFVNGQSLGRKPAGEENGFFASYETTYVPGELKAVSYRGDSTETSSLFTAGKAEKLFVETEGERLKADGKDLAFITIGLTDADGNENMFEEKEVTVRVTGAGKLQGFGSADPRCGESFRNTVCKTYDGYAMAVVRSGKEKGEIRVEISAPGCETKIIRIPVEEDEHV